MPTGLRFMLVRRLGYGCLLGALAAAALAAPAAAGDTVTASCVFRGKANTTPIGVLPNTGTYELRTHTFLCTAIEHATSEVVRVELDLTSQGTFSNFISCGTAGVLEDVNFWTGPQVTATVLAGESHVNYASLDFSYQIVYAGGHGLLWWTGEGVNANPAQEPVGGVVAVQPDITQAGSISGTFPCVHGLAIEGQVVYDV